MLLKEEQDETAIADAEKSISGGLPLTFYIRSARLCLKKASLARISNEGSSEELQHLRRFEALVACALPVHKEYSDRRGDKAVRELHVGLVEARRRIHELLETGGSPKKSTSPRKTGSPKTPRNSAYRPASRIRSGIDRNKLLRPPPPPTLLKKIRTTPKRDSPRTNRSSPTKNQRGSGCFKQLPSLTSSSPSKRPPKNSPPKSSPKVRRSHRSDDDPAYYLPKKVPVSVHKLKRAKDSSVDSRFETPSRRSSGSLATGMLRDIKSQHMERVSSLDFRKSYDDLPSYEDLQEICTTRTENGSVSHRTSGKSPGAAKPPIKVEKVWNNLVYEKSHSRASPSISAGRFDFSDMVKKELKKPLDGFRSRLDEEGKKWRGRMVAVEKEVARVRDETEGDLALIRKTVQEDAKKKDSSLKKLEGGILSEIEFLRSEVAKKGDKSWMESAISDAVEKCLVQQRSEGKESMVQEELRLLRSEVESLNQKRGELQGNLEELFQMMESDRECMALEQMNLKTENGYIKKQLQAIKKDELQALIDMDEHKKGCDGDLEDLKRAVGKLKDETAEIKHGLQGLEDTLAEKCVTRRSSSSRDGGTSSAEKMMIMDRVENLSKLYLGGLDEVRMDIVDIKSKCQDKLEELEDQLRDFKKRHESFPGTRISSRIVDELESRVHRLENKQEHMAPPVMQDVKSIISNVDAKVEKIESQLKQRNSGNSKMESRIAELEQKQESLKASKFLLEDAVAAAEKERRAAASAASEASGAATKASSSLGEILKFLEPETRNKARKTGRLRESLQDGLSVASRTSVDTEATLASALEAKKKADELQEELRNAVSHVEKQREAAAQAAAKASSYATESEDLLAEMSVMRRKVHMETEAETAPVPRTPASKQTVSELEKRVDALEKQKILPEKQPTRPVFRTRSLMKKKQGEDEETTPKIDPAKIDTRIGSLENHLEHVASATYTNLRILDNKVEHVSVSAQTALEGASIAENKCGALGAELVKVFRVLASFKKEFPEDRSKDSPLVEDRSKDSPLIEDRSKDLSPSRRSQFSCDSCKKMVTILNRSLESVPSENGSNITRKDVKRISVRLETEKPISEKEDSPVKPVRRSWETGVVSQKQEPDICW